MRYRNIFILIFSIFTGYFSSLFAESPYARKFEGHFQEYDGHRLDLIDKFLPKNPIIFEAGGHYGQDSVRFAQKWPFSTIITFEPNPHAYEKLLEAISNFHNIFPQNLALNTYNGTAVLNVCYGTTGDNPVFEGASSLLPASEGMKIHYQGPKIEVPCVILDDWCTENNISHIDFMWLDLEGLELQTLKSSPHILKTVQVIYTETNFYKFREGMTQYRELKQFLERSGFKLLSHWYTEGLQGDAIFVRQEIFPKGIKTHFR
ncbi:MAG: FkbM family methyltransferase [Parachlamydiales bacterium]|nr:FkbM family methyltransferase [Parachlamydiales bacterium]